MATADEKQAKQDAIDAAKQAATVGQRRLQTEVGQAQSAFPQRRLRTAGDLSRYAIGGFLSDPNAPLPLPGPGGGGGTPVPIQRPGLPGGTTGGGAGSGSGVARRPPGPAGTGSPSGPVSYSAGPGLNAIGGALYGGTSSAKTGIEDVYKPPAPLPTPNNLGRSDPSSIAGRAYGPAPVSKATLAAAAARRAGSNNRPLPKAASRATLTAANQRRVMSSNKPAGPKAASRATLNAAAARRAGSSNRPLKPKAKALPVLSTGSRRAV